MKLSTPQIARFWRLFGQAWRSYCAGTGENVNDAAAADRQRHEWITEAGTVTGSLKDIDRTHGFDRIMLLLAQVANDEAAVRYFAPAVERRMRFLIRERLARLSELTETLCDWRYARGIMCHMHLPATLDDVTAEQLDAVFMALDKHCRRIAVARDDAQQNAGNANYPRFGDGRRAKEWRRSHPRAA